MAGGQIPGLIAGLGHIVEPYQGRPLRHYVVEVRDTTLVKYGDVEAFAGVSTPSFSGVGNLSAGGQGYRFRVRDYAVLQVYGRSRSKWASP